MIPYETALAAFKASSEELGRPWVDAPEQADCLAKLIKWAIRSPEYTGRPTAGILLRGHRDSGKTHAMRCLRLMLNKIHESRDSFSINICQELVTQYNIEGDEALFSMSNEQRCLYDDLGEEREGNFMGKVCNVMAEVLGKRYRTMQERPLLTMFTTNIPNDEKMAAKYGERIATRINEMCDVIVWKGPKEGFRKNVAPLVWAWPGSPQQQEISDAAQRKKQAEWKVTREAEQAKEEERERIRLQKQAEVDAVEVEKAMKNMHMIGMETLIVAARSHPNEKLRAVYKAEIEKRAKAPVEDVVKFMTTPDQYIKDDEQ